MYISIASYRDPLLQSTIDSAFANAKNPDCLEVGCFIQAFNDDADVIKQLITNDYNGRVTCEVVAPGNIFSVTACRNRALSWLTESQDYVLQVDAHSRFEPNWDSTLIGYYQELNNPNALFSSYLPGWYPRENNTDFMHSYHSGSFSTASFNNQTAKDAFFSTYEIVPTLTNSQREPGTFAKSWYTCGHFIFGPAAYFLSVKQPDWILFWGEELFHSLVAFTNGWDVVIPPNLPVRHMFPQDVDSTALNKIWRDFTQLWHSDREASTDRVIDAVINKRIGPNYLGNARSLDELYEFIGYNLGDLLESWRSEYRKTIHKVVPHTSSGQ